MRHGVQPQTYPSTTSLINATVLVSYYRIQSLEDVKMIKIGKIPADVDAALVASSGAVANSLARRRIFLGYGGLANEIGRKRQTKIMENASSSAPAVNARLWLWCCYDMMHGKLKATRSTPSTSGSIKLKSPSSPALCAAEYHVTCLSALTTSTRKYSPQLEVRSFSSSRSSHE